MEVAMEHAPVTPRDIFRRRAAHTEIRRVAWAHADHFEPFDSTQDGQLIDFRGVARWLDLLSRCRHLVPSLFYSWQAWIATEINVSTLAVGTRFEEDRLIYQALEQAGLDLQVHVHHNEGFIAQGQTAEATRQQLHLLLELSKQFRGDRPWAFVHGCWGLQASDETACNIDDEIAILMEHGCVADFTFPAGRAWCTPKLHLEPYVIQAVRGKKGYDTLEAKPQVISKPHADGFLIWTADHGAAAASMDLCALGQSDKAISAVELLRGCPIIDGTLYIKTHAHSLNKMHWRTLTDTDTPVASDNVKRLVDCIVEACLPSATFDMITISQLMDEVLG